MIIALGTIIHMDPFTCGAYKKEDAEDEEFKGLYQRLQGQKEQIDADYHLQ